MSVTTSPFLEMIRREIRLRGYNIRTEKSYFFKRGADIFIAGRIEDERSAASAGAAGGCSGSRRVPGVEGRGLHY